MLLILSLLTSSFGAEITEEADAMRRAAEAAGSVIGAAADEDAARASVLASEAPFGAQVRADAGFTSNTNEGAGQFGRFFSETGGWRSSAGLDQVFATGTTVGLDLSSTQTRFLYRLADVDQEFTDDPQYQSSLALRVRQELLQGAGRAWNLQQVRAARAGVDAAELARRAAVAQAMRDAARAFRAAWLAQVGVDVAKDARDAALHGAEVVRALVETGRLAPVEGTRAELARVQAEQAVAQAGSALEDAKDALLRVTGAREDAVGVLRWAGTCPTAALVEPVVLEAVYASNPELDAARVRRDAARDALAGARRALLPRVTANGGVGVSGFEPSLGASVAELAGGTLRDWNVGAAVALPLGNKADRAAVERAEADLVRAEQAVVDLEDALRAATRGELRARSLAAGDLAAGDVNVRLAEEALAVEEARLAEGRGLVRDVTEARRVVAQARLDRERARVACADAWTELERMRGDLK